MDIDLERLHNLSINGKDYRGQGSTTLACDTCVNQVLLSQVPVIYGKLAEWSQIRSVYSLLIPMLEESGLKLTVASRGISFHGDYPEIIFFVNPRSYFPPQSLLAGRHDGMLVDFSDYVPPAKT